MSSTFTGGVATISSCGMCLRCGERYYAGAILLEIERRFKAIYEGHATPQLTLSVPVEALT